MAGSYVACDVSKIIFYFVCLKKHYMFSVHLLCPKIRRGFHFVFNLLQKIIGRVETLNLQIG